MMLDSILSYWVLIVALVVVLEVVEGRAQHVKQAKKHWPANLALTVIGLGLASAVPISGYIAAEWAQTNKWGLLNYIELNLILIIFLSLILVSLWDYFVHLASHKVSFLWRFHKIHHSDLALDVTTTYRTHPAMHVILSCANALMVVCLGLNPEAIIGHTVVVLLIDISHHTTLKIPKRLDQMLRPYIMTPSLHHIHHSDFVGETDTNYGHDIAVWDRLFGTYLANPKRPDSEFKYGLKNFPEERADSLDALLVAPFKSGVNS